jgi:hypothetical protein
VGECRHERSLFFQHWSLWCKDCGAVQWDSREGKWDVPSQNAELRAELRRMAVLVDLSADKSIDEDFGNEDLWSLVHKWLPKQEAQP